MSGAIRSRGLALVIAVAACGPAPAPTASVERTPPPAPKGAPELPGDEASFGKYHSKRFLLTVPLPDGRAWKIDDHTRPALHAHHQATSTELFIQATQEEDLMNRQRCEQRARDLGWVPEGPLTTVDEEIVVGPEAYDSRIWIALDAGRPGAAVDGHAYLFGAFLRRCLLVHVKTTVPSSKDEEVLASRLVLARTRILRGIALDAPRTTDDAAVPRDRPDIRR